MARFPSLMAAVFLLGACASAKVEDYAAGTPTFDLFEYFEGEVVAHGLFEDRGGAIKRQFRVDIVGTIDGDQIVLDEQFYYADGAQDTRIWTITRLPDGTYEGRAGDVVGVAAGAESGNVLNWRYDLDLVVGDTTWQVHFNDWMVRMTDDVMLNRARVSKFGFEVGSVTLVFIKQPSDGA